MAVAKVKIDCLGEGGGRWLQERVTATEAERKWIVNGISRVACGWVVVRIGFMRVAWITFRLLGMQVLDRSIDTVRSLWDMTK